MSGLCPMYLTVGDPAENGSLQHVPSIFRGESYEANARLVEAVARDSVADAVEVWKAAVGGSFDPGNTKAAEPHSRYGQPDWDYIVRANGRGQTEAMRRQRVAEDVGNANYAITGYALIMAIGDQVGLGREVSDVLAEVVLRAGGAAYQIREDVGHDKFLRMHLQGQRTWYGEERRDADVFTLALRHARLRDLLQRGLLRDLDDAAAVGNALGIGPSEAQQWAEFLRDELTTKDAYAPRKHLQPPDRPTPLLPPDEDATPTPQWPFDPEAFP